MLETPWGEFVGYEHVKELLQELTAEVTRLRDAQAWQPIATAPKDGSWMIVFRGVIGVGYYFEGQDGSRGWITRPYPNRALDGRESIDPPTHWMSLPASPVTAAERTEPA